MRRTKMCLNWKALAGLGAAGVGLYLVAPGMAALPLLLLAVCPLSMLLMMKGTRASRCEVQGWQASEETGAGMTREEQVTRLRMHQADLADRIEALEQEEEPQRAGNGKHGA